MLATLQQDSADKRIDGGSVNSVGLVAHLGGLPENALRNTGVLAKLTGRSGRTKQVRDLGQAHVKVDAVDGGGVSRLLLNGVAGRLQAQEMLANDGKVLVVGLQSVRKTLVRKNLQY